jgi:hypothetical protein
VREPRRIDVGAITVVALLLIIAAAALWQTRDFSPLGSIFPRTIGAALLIACVITLLRTLRRRTPMSRGLARDGWARGALLILVMSLWIALFEKVGFVAAGVAAYVALALITERDPLTLRRLIRFVLVAVAFVAVFQLVFVQGLKVPLPVGTLFANPGS